MVAWWKEWEEVKWIKHYSSMHEILLVGEGDFSFALSLAIAFGSGVNIVATSLDTEDLVVARFYKGGSNLRTLRKMGATLVHRVDVGEMRNHPDLRMRRFDRIVFNFPHAGFIGKEDDPRVINSHRNVVQAFFNNANCLLHPFGEVHVTHKTSFPFCDWNIEELASRDSLELIDTARFNIEDYPGYNNKRGDGLDCDRPFPLGECCTFMFGLKDVQKKQQTTAIPNLCSSFTEGFFPDRNVHPLAPCHPQNAYLSSSECILRKSCANHCRFSERFAPYLRHNPGGYLAEASREFKGVQEIYRNSRPNWFQGMPSYIPEASAPIRLIREPEVLPSYIAPAPAPIRLIQEPEVLPSYIPRAPALIRLIQEPEVLSSYIPRAPGPIRLIREQEVLPSYIPQAPAPIRLIRETEILPPCIPQAPPPPLSAGQFYYSR